MGGWVDGWMGGWIEANKCELIISCFFTGFKLSGALFTCQALIDNGQKLFGFQEALAPGRVIVSRRV